ncbi:hypothetical protein FRC03_006977, partial [Tulasnella sp. 419]
MRSPNRSVAINQSPLEGGVLFSLLSSPSSFTFFFAFYLIFSFNSYDTMLLPTKKDGIFVLTLALVLLVFLQVELTYRFDETEIDINININDEHAEFDSFDELYSVTRGYHQVPATANIAEVEYGVSETKQHFAKMPQTSIVKHSPGFTIFDKLFMMNGVVYIVSDKPEDVPAIRLMTSSGYPVFNPPEEVAKREPTSQDMRVISSEEASALFGTSATRVDGVSFLANDPPQFVNHYYHFSAELLFGLWRTYSSLDTLITPSGQTTLPPPRRIIFPHTSSLQWRDYSKMNQWVFKSAFPLTGMEFQEDWHDRSETHGVYIFDRVVFADRAASMRGGSYLPSERYASEAFNLPGSAHWWTPIRNNVVEFSGLSKISGGSTQDRPVITYVSRQGWGRRMLKPEDHEILVAALKRLESEHGYEVNIVEMDKLSRAEQIRIAGRTTIMMGVHGNALTSLLWMNPTPRSAVFEFFYPGGFTHDYEWTARAIG